MSRSVSKLYFKQFCPLHTSSQALSVWPVRQLLENKYLVLRGLGPCHLPRHCIGFAALLLASGECVVAGKALTLMSVLVSHSRQMMVEPHASLLQVPTPETLDFLAQDDLHRGFDNCEMRTLVICDAAGSRSNPNTTWFPGGRRCLS